MRTQTEERGTITLNKPVLINGVQVTEMSYDTDEISGELYAQAEAHKMKASGSKGGNLAGAVELDYSHTFIYRLRCCHCSKPFLHIRGHGEDQG